MFDILICYHRHIILCKAAEELSFKRYKIIYNDIGSIINGNRHYRYQ